MQYADIAVNAKTNLNRQIFTYKINPDQLPYTKPGIIVSVPFRNKIVEGIILELKSNSPFKDKLKSITKIIDTVPILTNTQLTLARWMSDYYMSPIGEVLFMMLPPIAKRLTEKCSFSSMKNSAKTMLDSKIFCIYNNLETRILKYSRLAKKALNSGKNSIIIFPKIEIAKKYLPFFQETLTRSEIILIHGDMTNSDRFKSYRKIYNGNNNIIIGTRASIFSPVFNLGLVIIDQPEDFGYKEEQTPKYNLIDVAKKLSQISSANLVLGSIYPDIDSYNNLKNHHYSYISKPEIANHLSKLKHRIVDINNEHNIISHSLENEIQDALNNKKKILLYVNRKGSGSIYSCMDCKKIIKCQRCNLPLIYFESTNTLTCNHCKLKINPPKLCANCHGSNLRQYGIGTESIKNSILKLFPRAKITIIDSDTETSKIDLKENDIVISTQKIMDSGATFHLTAVVQIDNSFNIPDYKSNENAYINLLELASITRNQFLIQTHVPDNVILNNLKSPIVVSDYLLNERNIYKYPPFGSLIKLIIKNISETKCRADANNFYEILTNIFPKINILGPNPSYIFKKRDKYYYQIILKLPLRNQIFKHKLSKINMLSKWSIDVDPVSLL